MAEEEQQPVFADALFRQKRKHGKFRLVEPPRLAGPVADTHAHVLPAALRRELRLWMRDHAQPRQAAAAGLPPHRTTKPG